MAKPQTRSETALQSAVMRFGDDAFRICYMHTKSGKETLTLLSDVFMQYFLDTQTFKSEGEERLWVLRTAHKTCMDYYAQKIRKKLTDEQIAQRSKDMPFETPKELCDILRLHYTLLTAVALHYGAGDNTRFIGRVTGKSASAVQNQLEKVKKAANMSEDDLREWVETLETPDDLLHRVYYSVLNESKDPHFTANSRAKRLKRNIDRAMPFAAVGVIVICLLCVVAVRAGWFGTKYVRTPDVVLESDTPVSSAAESEVSHVTLTPEPTASEDTREAVNMSLSIFVPSDSGLDQYSYKSLPADGAVLVQKMAEKGAFPEDVTLDALDYIKDGEVVSTMKSGEMLEVRLQFSGALQEYLDSASSTSSLEAIAKTFRAFYEAAGMTLSNLEVYSDGKPVTVGDMQINCTSLMYGELPVSAVLDGDTNGGLILMKILVIDGQGGKMGAALTDQIKKNMPDAEVVAVGTNSLATSAMLRAGADAAATGENPVVVNCTWADVIVGPIGIILANALWGEITPKMAAAVSECVAKKILIPVNRCSVSVVGVQDKTLSEYVRDAIAMLKNMQ